MGKGGSKMLKEIEFDHDRLYHSGDIIEGRVKLTVRKQKLKLLKKTYSLHFNGTTLDRIAWTTTRRQGDQTITEYHEVTHTVTLFNIPIIFQPVPIKKGYIQLSPGEHYYPFKVQVPEELPPTAHAKLGSHSQGASIDVTYTLNIKEGRKTKAYGELVQIGGYDQPLEEIRELFEEKDYVVTKSKTFIGGGGKDLSGTVTLNKKAFVRGENISVKLDIDNASSKNIKEIRFRFATLHFLSVLGKSRKWKNRTKPEKVKVSISKRSNDTMTQPLVIPDFPNISTETASGSIWFKLEIVIVPAAMLAKNLVVKIPIEIFSERKGGIPTEFPPIMDEQEMVGQYEYAATEAQVETPRFTRNILDRSGNECPSCQKNLTKLLTKRHNCCICGTTYCVKCVKKTALPLQVLGVKAAKICADCEQHIDQRQPPTAENLYDVVNAYNDDESDDEEVPNDGANPEKVRRDKLINEEEDEDDA